MEMRDPSSEAQSAEELTPQPAPASESAEDTTTEIETVDNLDPEAAAEDEMSEGLEEETCDNVSAPLTRDALLDAAKTVLAMEAADITNDCIRHLRHQYNAFRKATADNDGQPEAELPDDEEFKALLTQIREKKAEYAARVEAEKAENLRRKEEIINEILSLAEDTDNVNRTFPR